MKIFVADINKYFINYAAWVKNDKSNVISLLTLSLKNKNCDLCIVDKQSRAIFLAHLSFKYR
jgi:hypothetical protein